MNPILSAIFMWLSFRFRTRASLELEVIALRHQLEVLNRPKRRAFRKRPWFLDVDRMLWAWLYKIWPMTRRHMKLLKPKTVVAWHSRGFCWYWGRKSHHHGRPRIDPKLQKLIRDISMANPLWGNMRILGELLKLGIKTNRRAVERYRVRARYSPGPGWRVFIRSYMQETAAMDMFIVVSVTYRLLYGLVILSHDRRKILHIDATESPTGQWLSSQIKLAFSTVPVPRYIIRDRDALYHRQFCNALDQLGIQQVVTHAWFQNNYVERVILTIRKECLDHAVPLNERYLRGLLLSFKEYYNNSRTHQSLDLDCPAHRPVEPPSNGKHIIAIPQVGGLHHRYTRRRAA